MGDVVAGYGADVDLAVIREWWSLRSLPVMRWLAEHGFDPMVPGRRRRCVQVPDVRPRAPGGDERGLACGAGRLRGVYRLRAVVTATR